MTAQRIETGTKEGDELGFTAELFSGWLELDSGSRLYLHCLISRCRGMGNTQALIRNWLENGYDVRVVMPRPVMQHILGKFGFLPLREYLPGQYPGPVEVWYRPMSRPVLRIPERAPDWMRSPTEGRRTCRNPRPYDGQPGGIACVQVSGFM